MESNNKVKDDENLVSSLIGYDRDIIEIESSMPIYPDSETLMSMVSRWEDVARTHKKPVRVYIESTNINLEKILQKMVINNNNILLTIYPKEVQVSA